MKTRHVETTDIFRGAFYLCMGAELEAIGFRSTGSHLATFLFIGPDLKKHDLDYRNGRAKVNPLQFREALNHLRDLLFENLREKERGYGRTRENGALRQS